MFGGDKLGFRISRGQAMSPRLPKSGLINWQVRMRAVPLPVTGTILEPGILVRIFSGPGLRAARRPLWSRLRMWWIVGVAKVKIMMLLPTPALRAAYVATIPRSCGARPSRWDAAKPLVKAARMAPRSYGFATILLLVILEVKHPSKPTAPPGVTCAVVCPYGCDDGTIGPTRCALIDVVLGDRFRQRRAYSIRFATSGFRSRVDWIRRGGVCESWKNASPPPCSPRKSPPHSDRVDLGNRRGRDRNCRSALRPP